CMTRLNLLRLNTMPALDVRLLEDLGQPLGRSGGQMNRLTPHPSPLPVEGRGRRSNSVAAMRNDELRELGRLPFPLLRTKGDKGFRRIAWEEAYERMARRIRRANPQRIDFFG